MASLEFLSEVQTGKTLEALGISTRKEPGPPKSMGSLQEGEFMQRGPEFGGGPLGRSRMGEVSSWD